MRTMIFTTIASRKPSRSLFPGARWKFWTWTAGFALHRAAKAALQNGDEHEHSHITGMVQLGDSAFCDEHECVQSHRLYHIDRQWQQMAKELRDDPAAEAAAR